MNGNKGMVQVGGTTYRIVARADRHDVFRVLDDRLVGAFKHRPCLEVVRSEIGSELLIRVARAALQQARLAWAPERRKVSVESTPWLTRAHTAWGRMLDTLMAALFGIPAVHAARRELAGAQVTKVRVLTS